MQFLESFWLKIKKTSSLLPVHRTSRLSLYTDSSHQDTETAWSGGTLTYQLWNGRVKTNLWLVLNLKMNDVRQPDVEFWVALKNSMWTKITNEDNKEAKSYSFHYSCKAKFLHQWNSLILNKRPFQAATMKNCKLTCLTCLTCWRIFCWGSRSLFKRIKNHTRVWWSDLLI